MAKILGMGNALMDVMIRMENDSLLGELLLPKGSMQLVTQERSEKVLSSTKHLNRKITSGGSAANTISGLAELGMQTAFIAKVGKDQMGELFNEGLIKLNVASRLKYSDTPTGTAAALISPDSERTFATHLGASIELSANDLHESLFANAEYFYVEGYLVQNHPLLEKALMLAKKSGQKIFLDLASYNVVEENLCFLKHVVSNYVDVVFANEEEARAFTGREPADAAREIGALCEIAIVKIGAKGSIIVRNGKLTKVQARKAKNLDTTGAGDLYAAGFIYGYANKLSMEDCGKIASALSAKVIENIGARIEPLQWAEIKREIQSTGISLS